MKKQWIFFLMLQILTISVFALDIPPDLLTTLQSYIGKNVSDLPSDTMMVENSIYALVVQRIENPSSLVCLGFSVKNNRVYETMYQFICSNNQEINGIHNELLKIMEPYGQSQNTGDTLYRYRGFVINISRQANDGAYGVTITMSET